MAEDPLPPLILCMENASGEDVALRIEPDDDFQSFLLKSKSLLGFEVDIHSITRNQPVSLTDNIYQFLMNAEQNNPQTETTELNLDILDDNASSDFVYILDDGTQINASQIHFDDDENPLDLTVETLPFVKYKDDVDDPDEPADAVNETVKYNIIDSPVTRRVTTVSPKRSFVSNLPFKLLSSKAKNFEGQIKKYLEKALVIQNAVTATSDQSPEIVVQSEEQTTNVSIEEEVSLSREISSFTREQVLNMFKNSPVVTNVGEDIGSFNEKRRHIRKTDPSRPVPKKLDNPQFGYVHLESNCRNGSNCFMCNKNVDNAKEKLYLFDKEDQKLHRSSPQRKLSTQLKIICEQCLKSNFQPSRLKSPEKSLNSDEYLVIRNNQQYIFQRINSEVGKFVDDAKAIIDKVESEILKQGAQDKDVEFVKVEIGSDGEIINKSIDNKVDDVVVIKEEVEDDSGSDVQVIEPSQDLDDSVIENLEEADEEVKEFLGTYHEDVDTDPKCRFCQQEFSEFTQVIEHGSSHKHNVEDGEVFPCPLCDYGYVNFKWLKGHIKAAHGKIKSFSMDTREQRQYGDDGDGRDDNEVIRKSGSEKSSPVCSPIARRTRSSINKKKDSIDKDFVDDKVPDLSEKSSPCKDGDTSKDVAEIKAEVQPEVEPQPETILTEVKQEIIDNSDEEAIWIVQAGEDDSDVNEEQLKEILCRVRAQDKTQEATLFNIKDTHQCHTCKQLFVSAETLQAHKCIKRRGRKRKSGTKDDLYVPNQNDTNIKKNRKRKCKEPSSDPHVVTCHNCNESFTSKVRLKFHMQFHEPNSQMSGSRYSCTECGDASVFHTETELFDHVHFQHPKQKRWQCPVKECGKTFYLRATLTKHSRSHTDTRRYVCPACGKRFLDKQTLDEHGVTHLQMKPFECHICRKQLTRRSRLRMHVRAHEEDPAPALVLVCALCARAFKDRADAAEHATSSKECMETLANELKQEMEDNPRLELSPTSGLITEAASSDIAEKAFRRDSIKRHFEPEDKEKVAEMLSTLADEVRPLIRVVEIDKAFRCEYCEDVFYLEDRLNSHRAIHKGVKNPFTCHICKVKFATYSRCTTHKTTHGFYKRALADVKRQAETDRNGSQGKDVSSAVGILGYGGFPVVKHFLCEDCGRSYLHWTYLQVHRRMKHPDENLVYQCNHCDLTFPNRIPCRDCEEVLPNKTALYKHRSKEHNDVSPDNDKDAESEARSCDSCGCGGAAGGAGGGAGGAGGGAAGGAGHACLVCGQSFRAARALHAHLRTHTGERHAGDACARRCAAGGRRCRRTAPNRVVVIEMPGTFPSSEEVLKQLTVNNVAPESVIDINKISFSKGSARVTPKTESDLSVLLMDFTRDEDSERWSQEVLPQLTRGNKNNDNATHHNVEVDIQASTVGRSFCQSPRRPNILQRNTASNVPQQSATYPITLNITGEEISDVNVQLLLQEGILVNGEQMVQMQANESVLIGAATSEGNV